jgi:uncharacterized phage protein (TIGR02218 family)
MVYCWKIVRGDGVVQGFTEHDEDLTFDSVTYQADAGIRGSRIQQTLNLAPNNMNADGALSSDTINEDDLAAGVYDNAELTLYFVNWQDVNQREVIDFGNIGEVARGETAFSVEFRSVMHKLNQRRGRIYQRICDVVLGGSECGIDLTLSAYKGTGAVVSVDGTKLSVSGLTAFSAGFFTHGVLSFTSGLNSGKSFPVRVHSDADTVSLWEIPAETVSASDAFTITAGCDKLSETCKSKFSNLANFRGFPHIPGDDLLTQYASNAEGELDGGSYFE